MKRKAARAILIGLLVFYFGLVVLAFEEFVLLRLDTAGTALSRSCLRMFCISFAATVVLGVQVFILIRRRDLWSSLIDANESIRLPLALRVISGHWFTRRFAESRRCTTLVCVLFGLCALATVSIAAAYLYLRAHEQ